MSKHVADPDPLWPDDAHLRPGRGDRSARPARVAVPSDPAGWWSGSDPESTPLGSELAAEVAAHPTGYPTGYPAADPAPSPSSGSSSGSTSDPGTESTTDSFWGPVTQDPPRPSGRPVAVVELAAGPPPARFDAPITKPAPFAYAPEPVASAPVPVVFQPLPAAAGSVPTFETAPEPAADDVEPEPVGYEPEPEPVAVEPVVVEPVGYEPEPVAVEPVAVESAQPTAVPQQRSHRAPSPQQRELLRRASKRFEAAGDRFEIAQVTCEEAMLLVGAEVSTLVVRSVEGPRVLRQDPQGSGIWGAKTLAALMNLGRPLRKVIEGDPLSGGGRTALLVVPVPSAGSVAGTVIVRRGTGHAFSPSAQDCLERLARMAGAALDVAARRGMLIGLGRCDQVTGLAHRERLVEDLRSALLTVQTHGMPTSLVAADVSGLAALRDSVGRPAADETLAAVAAAVMQTLRVGDVAYRFGVDELAFLLPATSTQDATAAARRLRDAVDTLGLRPPGNPALRLRTAVLDVTGVAEDVVFRAIRALAGSEHESAVDA
jgi:diguanylate cyclase (GGDEF)-like protein